MLRENRGNAHYSYWGFGGNHLPPCTDVVVQGESNQLRIESGVWNVGLTFTPSRVRYIDADSDVGSHI